jgi:hypothetical protein
MQQYLSLAFIIHVPLHKYNQIWNNDIIHNMNIIFIEP